MKIKTPCHIKYFTKSALFCANGEIIKYKIKESTATMINETKALKSKFIIYDPDTIILT
jgi:hypothetical protein